MPTPGDRLADRYRILAPLGAGGMATVHRARDERLERDVAIKVLLPNLAGDPATARRFEREARAMAAVAHPGLVAVFDVDAGDPGTAREPFVVMELCLGGSLAERMGVGRPLPPDELVPILVAVADALAALHHAGLVHRDIKPSNILFAVDRVKLADFGLVRSDSSADAAELTDPGTAIGTLAYLAPERLRGDPGGPAADVFALATIAHLGLTGSLPRPTGSVRDLVAAAPFRAPAVSAIVPALGPAFDAAVLDGLAIDPGRRPDAVTFGSRLATALGAWTRTGRPGAVAAVPAEPGWVASASTTARPADDDATTALAMPVEQTDRYEPPAAPVPIERPAAPATRGERPGRRPAASPGFLATLLLGTAVVAAAVGLRAALGPSAGSGSPVPSAPTVAVSAPPALGSPAPTSPAPSPSATPARTPDPAVAALDAVDAAIAAARGGHGLKGKEANDLEALARRVRTALAGGDRSAALSDARDLDRRIRDLTKGDDGGDARRLRSASTALIDALGG
jgi:serine/threonine-protein kinase